MYTYSHVCIPYILLITLVTISMGYAAALGSLSIDCLDPETVEPNVKSNVCLASSKIIHKF